jgi:hypothetical protein
MSGKMRFSFATLPRKALWVSPCCLEDDTTSMNEIALATNGTEIVVDSELILSIFP